MDVKELGHIAGLPAMTGMIIEYQDGLAYGILVTQVACQEQDKFARLDLGSPHMLRASHKDRLSHRIAR